MIKLDELERLDKEATPAPWVHDHDFRDDGADQVTAENLTICFMATPIEYHEADTEIIVALRNAAPEIFQRIRELEAENVRLRESLALCLDDHRALEAK